ncbi:MAG: Rieske 2Fe-2S domain-containing protein [Nitrososphaerota archaeon]|nr:Rieske 2Fe-2S domain-containing protein [Nitrososphaerota archaeon]
MVEDTKEKPPSQQKDSEAEKKPAPPPVTPARPLAPVPPRPPAPVQGAPVQPPPVQPPKSTTRRTFIRALVAVSAVLSIVPFVPWGDYLLSSVSTTGAYKRQQAVLDLNTPTNNNANGAVAGKAVNVNDLTNFPPNSSWLLTYPSSGDLTVDSQNPDTFQKFGLIRLPNGTTKSAADFVAFSKVCVHLWCSPNYDPEKSTNPVDESYQCPCHGSIYRVPDGLSIAGPASLQAYPTNAIPMLTLTADPNGDLYIEPPKFDVAHNGVIGYGRDYQSYEDYILPVAEGKQKP